MLILLTQADPFQQEQSKLTYLDLERSAKNALLLFGRITLPGSSILKSSLTATLVKNARQLLQCGMIVPDLRDVITTSVNMLK